MNLWVIIGTAFGYMGLLFLVAHYAERQSARGRSLVDSPLIYALSLSAYCTAWTFYGSVGRAATHGLGYLPIYLGPTIVAPLFPLLLRKIILISKAQRITSVADFISSRYGKSTALGILATLVCILGIVPYISIQLKAISISFGILVTGDIEQHDARFGHFYQDSSLYIAVALATFTILFGTRKLDPNERHEGLVASLALESVIKLAAFVLAGLFVCFGLYNGMGDLFSSALKRPEIARLFTLEKVGIDPNQWFWLTLVSMSAVLFLPRQFHLAVVENIRPGHTTRAAWLFPLYLLLISFFVLPIAIGGLTLFPDGAIEPDTFVLSLPLHFGQNALALFIALGGFSAATSMVIAAVISLSIMISNNLVLPLLLKPRLFQEYPERVLPERLLGIRRVSIVVVLFLAYMYFKLVGADYPLASIGLISFTAIAQFLPATIGGIFWKRATKAGAIAGLSIGFLIWIYTLPLPTMIETGLIQTSLLEKGAFGLSWLRPYSLMGLDYPDQISHAAFWSLMLNTLCYVGVSLYTRQSPLEISQADLFVDIYKYRSGSSDYEVRRRRARMEDIRLLLGRFLGEARMKELLHFFEQKNNIDLSREHMAQPELVSYAETQLAGSIGAASAKIIIRSIAREDPISLEEMLNILEQTQEIMQYSRALEKKSAELERTTAQLKQANEQLQELDRLKADFITTVTHELRTPITSIKALARIVLENEDLPPKQQREFLEVIVSESERIARLINQVLDLEKLQAQEEEWQLEQIELGSLVQKAFQGLEQIMKENAIHHSLLLPEQPLRIRGHWDRLTQVVVNLLSNAVKFCPKPGGEISVSLKSQEGYAVITVSDNGPGIEEKNQAMIFDKFTQVQDQSLGKPQGSGLGLFISRTIAEQHKGFIQLHSQVGKGASFQVFLPLGRRSGTQV